MKITTPMSNAGNFDYSVSCEMSEALRDYFAGLGLLQHTQRSPISGAEKTLAGHTWPKGKKGEPQRPKGWERTSIEYSEEAAEVFRQALASLEVEIDTVKHTLTCEVIVSEHEVATAVSKWAIEKDLIDKKEGDLARLTKLADKVGYEPTADSDLVSDNVAFCAAIRAYRKEREKQDFAD